MESCMSRKRWIGELLELFIELVPSLLDGMKALDMLDIDTTCSGPAELATVSIFVAMGTLAGRSHALDLVKRLGERLAQIKVPGLINIEVLEDIG
eukprot:2089634-Amphidinium_carterae.1